MGRKRGAVCKLCRREGDKLYLKGERCFTAKCSFDRRSYAPGIHGQRPTRRKISEYGLRLREKQKARWIYGLSERQFRSYFDKAAAKKGVTGEVFLQFLERRLDNVIYRLGMATSRREGRQLVRHGHILVKGRKVNIPSFQVRVGDTVTPSPRGDAAIKKIVEKQEEKKFPPWLSFDSAKFEGQILAIPKREEIDTLVQENLIVEFYSR